MSATRRRQEVRIPRSFEGRANFEALTWLQPAARKAMVYCLEFARSGGSVRPPLLMGPSGCGKTHLIYATARVLCSVVNAKVEEVRRAEAARIGRGEDCGEPEALGWPGIEVAVTSGSEIAHSVRGSVEARNLDDVVARFRQEDAFRRGGTGILFVDDIEVCKMSDWLHEELYRIFDFRYAQALPTLLATNLSPEELRHHLGDRLARRVVDMTEPFRMG